MPIPVIDAGVNWRLHHVMGVAPQDFTVSGSALAWWRDAGVDSVVSETPFAWLATKPVQRAVKPVAEAPKPVAPLPDTIAEFTNFLMAGDIPEAGPPNRRLAPAGKVGARLMILADFPDRADIDAGRWFAGELEAMFDKMLAALNTDRDNIYLASLCSGRPARGMIESASLPRLTEIARHHVTLATPQQLWLMGSAASRAILGVDDARARGTLHHINLNHVTLDVIATAHPRTFQGQKAMRAAAWTEMQRLLEGNEA